MSLPLRAIFFTIAIAISTSSVRSETQSLWQVCVGKDYRVAIEACTKILSRKTTRDLKLQILYSRSRAYLGTGQVEHALADANQLIKFAPSLAEAFHQRGRVYNGKKDYGYALRDYSKAIELKPTLAAAFGDRGYTHYLMGQREKAMSDYDMALKLDPKSGRALNNRGLLLLKLEQYERAIVDLTKYIDLAY